MSKRLLAFFLCAVLLLTGVPLSAQAAAPSGYTEKKMQVCFNGAQYEETVLTDGSGTVYVPFGWMKYYGLYEESAKGNAREYYYPGEANPVMYSKRIFLDGDKKSYAIKVYVGKSIDAMFAECSGKWFKEYTDRFGVTEELGSWLQKNFPAQYSRYKELTADGLGYETLVRGSFSKVVSHNKDQWVPLHELMPLLGAHVDIFDGALQIQTVTVSIWEALSGANFEDLVFYSDDVLFGEEVTTPLNYLTSTIVDFKYKRIFSYDNSGNVEDYETIFKSYLADNETYLKAFDGANDIRQEKLDFFKEYFKSSNTAMKLYNTLYSVAKATNQTETFLAENFKLTTKGGTNVLGEVLDGIGKIYDYYYIYVNQVDDHREMLGKTYSYFAQMATGKEYTERINCPSYRAAKNIKKLYGEKAEALKEAQWQALDELGGKLITGLIENTALAPIKPAVVALKATTTLMKTFGNYDTIENGALLYKEDKVCRTSYQCYEDARLDIYFEESHLEEIRLLGLMALEASRHAYETHAPWEKDRIAELEELLTEFYLAKEGMGFEDPEHIKELKNTLKSKIKNLTLTGGQSSTQNGTQETKPSSGTATKPSSGSETKPGTTDWAAVFADTLKVAAWLENYSEEDGLNTDVFDALLLTHTVRDEQELPGRGEDEPPVYRYYYKATVFDAWTTKFFGKVFDRSEIAVDSWAYSVVYNEASRYVEITENGFWMALGTRRLHYISHTVQGDVYTIRCKLSMESEEMGEVQVVVRRSKDGYAILSVN